MYALPPSWAHADFRQMTSLDQEGSLPDLAPVCSS
jgi:hypothetical protein